MNVGYMVAISACAVCGQLISYNPDRVPSIRVNGVREPVCRNCIERANEIRKTKGLDPIRILPGAYDAEEVS